MAFLEHRIPPPIVALVLALLMWLSVLWLPGDGFPPALRYALAAIAMVAGLGFVLPATRAFRRAGTTVNPIRIENASGLVTDGIYRLSRNPMYVGMTLVLVAIALLLDGLLALVGPVLFVAWITRFQIIPEERVLVEKFGEAYAAYRQRVRRWL
jgi:protein-S-isoprenylcysteine O-methyltransferase Ste14